MKIKTNGVDPGHFEDLKRSCGFYFIFKFFFFFFVKESAFLGQIH
jgi:hypothetical protein